MCEPHTTRARRAAALVIHGRAVPAPAAALVIFGLAVLAPAPAAAAAIVEREVCASRATLLSSPRGMPVASVIRGDAVLLLARGEGGRWVRVKTGFGSRGWLRAKALCREERS